MCAINTHTPSHLIYIVPMKQTQGRTWRPARCLLQFFRANDRWSGTYLVTYYINPTAAATHTSRSPSRAYYVHGITCRKITLGSETHQ